MNAPDHKGGAHLAPLVLLDAARTPEGRRLAQARRGGRQFADVTAVPVDVAGLLFRRALNEMRPKHRRAALKAARSWAASWADPESRRLAQAILETAYGPDSQ